MNLPNRDHLKNRILVQGQGGREVPTGGILKYFEDWNRAPNAEIGPKDIFEMVSKYGLVALFFLLSACSGEQRHAPAQVPHGYYATLRMVADGRQIHLGPFVGYYFKPADANDFSRLDFICLNERQFYTRDLPDGAKLYEGEAIQTTLPREIPLPAAGGDRMHPIFDKDIPAAWWATRPQPREEFVHFHSGYDAAGPVHTGYWLRHRAVAAFTYDMGGRVGPESILYHKVNPGPDRDFARIVEFDWGPGKSMKEE
jgi:hypothetical protein